LTREKTIARKVKEAILATRIEKNFTKDEILYLYLNQIFLGNRAYGFAAAAEAYFGKSLQNITVAEAAMLAGYTVVDPSTVVATHLTEVFRRNLQDFLGRQEVQELLNNLAKRAPKAVDNLVPNMLPLGTVQKVLQNLVREGVSIRDMLTITEALCDYGPSIQDAGMLTEYVRARMGRTIVRSYMASDGSLPIVTLSGEIDELLTLSLRSSDQGGYLALEPGKAQQVIRAISTAQDNTAGTDGQPVLLTAPQIRPHLAQLLLRFLPTMPVVSQAEIPADIRIQSLATVKLS